MRNNRDAFREAFRAKGIDLDEANLAKLVAAKSRAFPDGIRYGVTVYPGAISMIESLRAAGRPLALQWALRSDIEPILAQLGIPGCFDVIVSADDVRRSKPNRKATRSPWRLSERSGTLLTLPIKSIAIEDTAAGIRFAEGAHAGCSPLPTATVRENSPKPTGSSIRLRTSA